MLSLSMVIFDIPRALYHETEKWFVSVIPCVVVLSYRVMLSNICLKFSQWIGKIRLHFIMLCSCWCIHYHTQFSRQVSDVSYLSFWWREAGTVNVPPFLLLWHFLLNAFIYLSIHPSMEPIHILWMTLQSKYTTCWSLEITCQENDKHFIGMGIYK